jgi:hypothetical protein
MRVTAFLGVQLLDGISNTKSNLAGALPGILAGAGLEEVEVSDRFRLLFGTLDVLTARGS